MALKDWKKTVNQEDYIVWGNDKIKKQVAVYRNLFMVLNLENGVNRNYEKRTKAKALVSAKAYMRKN